MAQQPLQSIDKAKWLEILSLMEKNKNTIWLEVLLMFFYQSNHQATIKEISRQYSLGKETLRTLIENISAYVHNILANDPALAVSHDSDLLFQKKQANSELLQLSHSLIAALRVFLIDKIIRKYRGPVLEQGLDNRESEELYKWEIFSECNGKPTKDILDVICSGRKEMNFLSWRITNHIKKSLKSNPVETIGCFDILRNTEGDFYERFSAFVTAGNKFLSKDAAALILKENVASVFLSCVDPTEFVVYRWTVYELIAKYLGYKPDRNRPYERFTDLLKKIEERESEDEVLMNKIKTETEKYFWNPLLNSQDVIWQTHNYIKESYPKNWLQKLYEKGLSEQHWIFEDWAENYTASVNTFLDMFAEGKTSNDVDDETKDLFLRVKDNSISSNGQGMYSYEEYGRILEHWDEIYEVLKRNVEADTIFMDDYRHLNELIQSLLSKRKPTAYHRIWAGIFPDKLCTVIERYAFNGTYEKIRQIDDSLPPLKDTWVESNQTLMDYFKDKVNFKEEHHRPIFGWYLKGNLDINGFDKSMQKYIELLESSHNLVLTGAPGTGKTYLARKIAEAMGDSNPGFVQFHPSLDYTDFVEGLRPNPETSTFERVDGIFKKFCKESLSGVQFSDFDNAYESFIKELLELPEDNKLIRIQTPKSGAEFGVSVNSKMNLNLHTGKGLAQQGVLKRDDLKRMFSGEKVYDYWKGYYEGVLQYLKDNYQLKDASPTQQSGKRIFIIDEINRGELSKIFGELFFSIDPSYRGEKNRIATQYQNLVPPGDPFEKGFYVPDNVYIIGTMNDIDRGVESMDFAIRRRFGWVEIKPDDRKEMLIAELPQVAEKAVKVMESVNRTLTGEHIDLPEAYEIGPAYFLKLNDYGGDFHKLWDYNIRLLLSEYLRGDRAIKEKMEILKESFFKPLDN